HTRSKRDWSSDVCSSDLLSICYISVIVMKKGERFMEDTNLEQKTNQLYKVMLVAGIVTVAFNLRPAITSVGPLMGIIRDDIGLRSEERRVGRACRVRWQA